MLHSIFMLAFQSKIMFTLGLHDDPIHALRHHRSINLPLVQQSYHPRDVLVAGQPEDGIAVGRTTYPLSSTSKEDKEPSGRVFRGKGLREWPLCPRVIIPTNHTFIS